MNKLTSPQFLVKMGIVEVCFKILRDDKKKKHISRLQISKVINPK